MELEDLQGVLRIMGWWGDDGTAIRGGWERGNDTFCLEDAESLDSL